MIGRDQTRPPGPHPAGDDAPPAHRPEPADERALAELRGAGAQLDAARPVQHFVVCASRDQADDVSTHLRAAGFEASPFENPTAAGWIVVAERTEVVDVDSIALGRSFLELIADRTASHYDGWHTQLLDDERPTFGVRGRNRF